MKKNLTVRLASCALVLALAGCTANNATTAASTAGTDTTGADNAATDATATQAASDSTDASSSAQTGATETFETKEFFDRNAYLSAIDLSKYVTLGDYKELEITVPETTVDDAEIESTISYYEAQMAVPTDVTGRALQKGDIAQLDYSGRIKETGEVFEGGTATGQTLEIGSGSFIDGFEDGMVGMEIGETKELELTFPDPYINNPDLAGVPVIFTVTLNGIQEPGEMTDEVVKSLGIEGVETVAQFRSYLETYMKEDAAASTLAATESAAAGTAVENATFTGELPEEVLERYQYMIRRSAYYQAQSQGITSADLIAQTITMEGFEGSEEEYVKSRAEEQVKELLVYEAICRAEKLDPSEKELTDGIAEVLLQTGFETVEDYEKEQGLLLQEAYRENLMALAVRSFLAENAKVTYE